MKKILFVVMNVTSLFVLMMFSIHCLAQDRELTKGK